jgi:hypothetical protein
MPAWKPDQAAKTAPGIFALPVKKIKKHLFLFKYTDILLMNHLKIRFLENSGQ